MSDAVSNFAANSKAYLTRAEKKWAVDVLFSDRVLLSGDAGIDEPVIPCRKYGRSCWVAASIVQLSDHLYNQNKIFYLNLGSLEVVGGGECAPRPTVSMLLNMCNIFKTICG